MKGPFRLLSLAVVLQLIHPAFAAGDTAPDSKRIVFVCLHGSVKSQVAAAHFNRIDGLIFNAVRGGDRVEVTVETIDGTRMIVGLKKE